MQKIALECTHEEEANKNVREKTLPLQSAHVEGKMFGCALVLKFCCE